MRILGVNLSSAVLCIMYFKGITSSTNDTSVESDVDNGTSTECFKHDCKGNMNDKNCFLECYDLTNSNEATVIKAKKCFNYCNSLYLENFEMDKCISSCVGLFEYPPKNIVSDQDFMAIQKHQQNENDDDDDTDNETDSSTETSFVKPQEKPTSSLSDKTSDYKKTNMEKQGSGAMKNKFTESIIVTIGLLCIIHRL
ncbi:hypothetical protein BB559_006855 [Furculomyces boomerangus]|uniref:Extracellular membrane protein CFEM domain-containing protein n=2 Tax=Harpellales TaxID=61421 RepID=A0A2T9Y047_9FUNG|nr:hypothetical protein BB559_006855 [Furculomyces boomerangus]PVZ96989.1 hypothetical protein BB558_007073 [Smittium angustum]